MKKLFISRPTAKRLVKMYNFDIKITEEPFVIIENINKNFNTSNKKWLYNNKLGEFFVGDPTEKDEKNQKIKTYKILYSLLKHFNPSLSEAELKKQADRWLQKYSFPEIQILDDIEKVYNMEMPGSCMVGRGEFYRDLKNSFKDNLKIAVMINNNSELLGRALLWGNVEVVGENKTIKVMDRIYSRDNSAAELAFKKWAKKHGYYYKAEQSYSNLIDFINPEGELETLKVKVTGKYELNDYDYLPYLDTFRFFKNKSFYNYEPVDCEFVCM